MLRDTPCYSVLEALKIDTVTENLQRMSMSNSTSPAEEKKKPDCTSQDTSRQWKYPLPSWGPSPVPADEDPAQARKLRQHEFTSRFLRSAWPKDHEPPSTLASMNAEETAIWIQMLGKFKGWKEARIYAQSFKSNCVTGFVLPYLSVKALRTELDIEKFGHRLEIIAAIEKSELTLVNPVIITIRPNSFFASVNKSETPNSSNPRYIRKEGHSNNHTEEVNKWFSNIPRNSSPLLHGREDAPNKFVEAEWARDHDPECSQMSWAMSPRMPKTDANSKMMPKSQINSAESNKMKVSESNTENSSISSSAPELNSNKGSEDITLQFVRWGEERLRSIFANATSERTITCVGQELNNNNCWGNLAVVGNGKLGIHL